MMIDIETWPIILQFEVPTVYYSISKFGFIGAPLGQVFAAWMLLLVYMLYFAATGLHKKCWHGFSSEALNDWGIVLKLGAGGTMRCDFC